MTAFKAESKMRKMTRETKEYTATEARTRFSDIFDEAYHGERVVVRKRKKEVAVVSMKLIQKFEELLEMEAALEAQDASAALEQFQSEGGKTLEQMKQELGMD